MTGRLFGLFLAILSLLCSANAFAQEVIHDLNIEARSMNRALLDFGQQTNTPLLFSYDVVEGLTANEVVGSYTTTQAIDILLEGTGLRGSILEGGGLSIGPIPKEDEGISTVTEPTQTQLSRADGRRRRSLLAGVSAAVLAISGASAQETVDAADDAETRTLDAVVVSGIRGSLQSAQAIKRDSNAFVDAVTNEDVGKFPDNNVAEALQRIPGVTIDRANGEGQGVTVRGFGPDFNTVLLNGRRLASDAAAVRGFQFDLISAELIGGAEVYKTAPTHLQEGGIGSTINLNTLRPLDAGPLYVVKAAGTYENLADDFGGSAFGLFSQSFANDTIGVLGAVSYQRRNSVREFADTGGYLRQTVAAGATDGFANSVGNVPGTYFTPRNFNIGSDSQERDRIGVNGTLQFRPNDQFEFTVDGLWSSFVVDSEITQLGNFYVPGSNLPGAVVDENNTVVSFVNGNRVNAFIQTSDNRDSQVFAIGGNLKWTPSDNFTGSFDVSYSSAENDGTSDDGSNYFTVIREFANISFDNTAGGIPVIASDVGFAEDLNALTSHFADRRGTNVEDDLFELKADFEWTSDIGLLQAIRAGALYSEEERINDVFGSASPCFNCGDTTPIPAGFATAFDSSGFLSSSDRSFTGLVSYDANDLFAFFESPEGLAARDVNLGLAPGTSAGLIPATGYDLVLRPGNSFSVDEDIFALHGEAQFGSDEGLLPWTLVAGFRYVETDVRADGTQRTLLDLASIPNDPTEFAATFGEDALVEESSSYSNFLPSVNFRVEPVDGLVLRFAYSETLTRPSLTDLTPVLAFPAQFRPSLLQASAGNVNLTPFESKNFDFSAEYYFGQSSVFSAAYFNKEVDGFIVTLTQPEALDIANAEGLATPLIAGQSATFNVSRPQNLETATVEGFEIALTHTFDYLPAPFNGFGVQANATFVDSDAEVDVNNTSQSFALSGLGDSRSFVGFYEHDRFNFRLAYTVRDEFLVSAATGAGGEPLFTDDFGQLDARLTVFATDRIELFVDGINLTNEVREQRGRFANHFGLFEETGARYSFGATYKF